MCKISNGLTSMKVHRSKGHWRCLLLRRGGGTGANHLFVDPLPLQGGGGLMEPVSPFSTPYVDIPKGALFGTTELMGNGRNKE